MSHADFSLIEGDPSNTHEFTRPSLQGYSVFDLQAVLDELIGTAGNVGITQHGDYHEFHVSSSMSAANKAKVKGFLMNLKQLTLVTDSSNSLGAIYAKYSPSEIENQNDSNYFMVVGGKVVQVWSDIPTDAPFYTAGDIHFRSTVGVGVHHVLVVSKEVPYKSGEAMVTVG